MWTLIFVYSLNSAYIYNSGTQYYPVTITKEFKTKQGCEFMQKWLENNTSSNRKRIDISVCIKGE